MKWTDRSISCFNSHRMFCRFYLQWIRSKYTKRFSVEQTNIAFRIAETFSSNDVTNSNAHKKKCWWTCRIKKLSKTKRTKMIWIKKKVLNVEWTNLTNWNRMKSSIDKWHKMKMMNFYVLIEFFVIIVNKECEIDRKKNHDNTSNANDWISVAQIHQRIRR